jgi:hypothetical protein
MKIELTRIVFYFNDELSVYWQPIDRPKDKVSGQYYQASVYKGSNLEYRCTTDMYANKSNSKDLILKSLT